MKFGFTFPASLSKFDASAATVTNGAVVNEIFADWGTNAYGSGDAIIDVAGAANGGMIFIADIKTGSTANTYGDFAVIFAQYASNATSSTMSENSCVEVLKY
jgi:hypothetical protein